jgi:Flp pilus assembly protein TadD
MASWLLAATCALVVGVFGLIACTRDSELGNRTAADAYYNLLVSGFRSGQLNLKQEAPAGLATLPDPYDPEASSPFRGAVFTDTGRVHDLSYFRGRLYLYFGVTPALLLFWPVTAVTGHYVSHQQAVALFAAAGYLLSVWLLRSAWRRYFPEASPWVVAAGALALGLANGFPIILTRPDVWEVPIFCGYALSMLTLVLVWRAVHEPGARVRLLALASLAFGLAVGARPSLLFGAVVLLVPVAVGWTAAGPARWRLLLAATGPIAAVGCGLMVYNQLRFGSPFEFGQTYQLAGERQDRAHFGLEHLGFNLRAYFFTPTAWGGGFPFVQSVALPPAPVGHGGVEVPFGAVAMIPFTWLAVGLGLARRDRGEPSRRGWVLFLTAPAVLFFTSALVLGCFYGTCARYEAEFVPMLVLLAALGALALDRGLAGRPPWRRAARVATGAVLLYSVTFNVLAGIRWRADLLTVEGASLVYDGRDAEAVAVLEQATTLKPGLGTAQMTLALAYGRTGRADEASARIAEAVRRNPAAAEQYYRTYGQGVLQVGRPEDLLLLLNAALQQTPGSAGLHNELGAFLAGRGRLPEALPHFETAVRLEPGNPGNLANLGMALAQLGRPAEARTALQKALQLEPNLDGVREYLARLQPAAGAPPPFLLRP